MASVIRLLPMRDVLRMIRDFVALYPKRAAWTLVAMLAAGLMESIGLGSVLPLMGLLAGDTPFEHPLGRAISRLLVWMGLQPTVGTLLALIVCPFVLKALIGFAVTRYVAHTAAEIAAGLRLALLRVLTAARWPYFIRQPPGRLAYVIGMATEQTSVNYVTACRILACVIQVAAYATLACLASWRMTLAALAVGAAGMAAFHVFVRRVRHAGVRFAGAFEAVTTRLVDSLQGIKPIKAMGQEDRMLRLLEADIDELKTWQCQAETNKAALRTLREPLQVVAAAILFWTAWRTWGVGIDVLAVCVLLFVQVLNRLGTLQCFVQELVHYAGVFETVRAVIAEAEGEGEPLPSGMTPALNRGIRLDRVSFAHEQNPILLDASLEIPANGMTVLIGPSGAGKTTVVDLVAGLIRPDSGRILVDDTPLDRLDLRQWRSMVGYVSQEPFLLHDTVLKNITLGDPVIDEAQVVDALKAAMVWDVVTALPEGLQTVVGERGLRLSGGERQRITIARALARKPRLVVLDEATSAVDPQTENGLLASLKDRATTTAFLVVAHRSGFSGVADRVYRVENSGIVPVDSVAVV